MPSTDVNSPASSAPTDRIALGVSWVRPGVAGTGGTLNPSSMANLNSPYWNCFEGNEE